MEIKWTSVIVNDQEIALRFYTDMLGFQKKGGLLKWRVSMADRGFT